MSTMKTLLAWLWTMRTRKEQKALLDRDLAILKNLFAGVADKWIVGGHINVEFGARKARGKNLIMIEGVKDHNKFEKFWELWTGMSVKRYIETTGEFPPLTNNNERVTVLWFSDHELWNFLERVKLAQDPFVDDYHVYEVVSDLRRAGWPSLRIFNAAQKAGRPQRERSARFQTGSVCAI